MRLSDLLERPVVDETGRSWGKVHDVHLIQDGPLQPSGLAAFRIHGLIAGRGALGTRLGYTRRPGIDQVTRGPLPLRLLMEHYQRSAVYIPWDTVQEVNPESLVVSSPPRGFEAQQTRRH
jgi:sporulation protein YlmC with PRC-barrel domain